MELPTIAALRPTGGSAADIAAAIARTEEARAAAFRLAGELEREMKASLLTATDAQMEATERAADKARRDADRMTALLEELQAAHANAEARESADTEEARRAAVVAAFAAADAVWAKLENQILTAAAKVAVARREAEQIAAVNGWTPRPTRLRHPVYDPLGPLDHTLALAAFAPSEIERRDAEIAARDAAEQDRRRRDQADRDRRVSEGLARQRAEAAEADRERQARVIPNDMVRQPVHVTGGGW